MSGEIEKILAQVRKRGIAVSLAHQWQGQIAKADIATLEAVRNSTEVKIVFRLKDTKEAEDLAPMVLPFNLELPVRTLDKPVVVGHRRVVLDSASRGESSGSTH